MKILHLIRTPHETLARDLAGHQQAAHEVSVLLLQDGVFGSPAVGSLPVYTLRADLEARGLPAGPRAIDYDGAVRLIAEHDRVVVW